MDRDKIDWEYIAECHLEELVTEITNHDEFRVWVLERDAAGNPTKIQREEEVCLLRTYKVVP